MSKKLGIKTEQGPVNASSPLADRILEINFDSALAPDITPKYATNIVVQRTEHEFIISFFEVIPPILIGSPDKILKKLEEMDGAPTRCVARIIVAASRMEDFVKALGNSLQNAPMVISE